MKRLSTGFARVGGFTSAASGILFLIRGILDFLVGPPPSTGTEILSWAANHVVLLAFENEATFFAALFLVPAMAILYHTLRDNHWIAAVTGCGINATTIPLLMVLVIIQGRLVYPVFGITVNTPRLAEFVISLFYGGLHAVDIIVGIATFVLGLSMRRDPGGRLIVSLSVLIGLLDIVGAYPNVIGPIGSLVSQTFFSLWFVVLGSILISSGRKAQTS